MKSREDLFKLLYHSSFSIYPKYEYQELSDIDSRLVNDFCQDPHRIRDLPQNERECLNMIIKIMFYGNSYVLGGNELITNSKDLIKLIWSSSIVSILLDTMSIRIGLIMGFSSQVAQQIVSLQEGVIDMNSFLDLSTTMIKLLNSLCLYAKYIDEESASIQAVVKIPELLPTVSSLKVSILNSISITSAFLKGEAQPTEENIQIFISNLEYFNTISINVNQLVDQARPIITNFFGFPFVKETQDIELLQLLKAIIMYSSSSCLFLVELDIYFMNPSSLVQHLLSFMDTCGQTVGKAIRLLRNKGDMDTTKFEIIKYNEVIINMIRDIALVLQDYSNLLPKTIINGYLSKISENFQQIVTVNTYIPQYIESIINAYPEDSFSFPTYFSTSHTPVFIVTISNLLVSISLSFMNSLNDYGTKTEQLSNELKNFISHISNLISEEQDNQRKSYLTILLTSIVSQANKFFARYGTISSNTNYYLNQIQTCIELLKMLFYVLLIDNSINLIPSLFQIQESIVSSIYTFLCNIKSSFNTILSNFVNSLQNFTPDQYGTLMKVLTYTIPLFSQAEEIMSKNQKHHSMQGLVLMVGICDQLIPLSNSIISSINLMNLPDSYNTVISPVIDVFSFWPSFRKLFRLLIKCTMGIYISTSNYAILDICNAISNYHEKSLFKVFCDIESLIYDSKQVSQDISKIIGDYLIRSVFDFESIEKQLLLVEQINSILLRFNEFFVNANQTGWMSKSFLKHYQTIEILQRFNKYINDSKLNFDYCFICKEYALIGITLSCSMNKINCLIQELGIVIQNSLHSIIDHSIQICNSIDDIQFCLAFFESAKTILIPLSDKKGQIIEISILIARGMSERIPDLISSIQGIIEILNQITPFVTQLLQLVMNPFQPYSIEGSVSNEFNDQKIDYPSILERQTPEDTKHILSKNEFDDLDSKCQKELEIKEGERLRKEEEERLKKEEKERLNKEEERIRKEEEERLRKEEERHRKEEEERLRKEEERLRKEEEERLRKEEEERLRKEEEERLRKEEEERLRKEEEERLRKEEEERLRKEEERIRKEEEERLRKEEEERLRKEEERIRKEEEERLRKEEEERLRKEEERIRKEEEERLRKEEEERLRKEEEERLRKEEEERLRKEEERIRKEEEERLRKEEEERLRKEEEERLRKEEEERLRKEEERIRKEEEERLRKEEEERLRKEEEERLRKEEEERLRKEEEERIRKGEEERLRKEEEERLRKEEEERLRKEEERIRKEEEERLRKEEEEKLRKEEEEKLRKEEERLKKEEERLRKEEEEIHKKDIIMINNSENLCFHDLDSIHEKNINSIMEGNYSSLSDVPMIESYEYCLKSLQLPLLHMDGEYPDQLYHIERAVSLIKALSNRLAQNPSAKEIPYTISTLVRYVQERISELETAHC